MQTKFQTPTTIPSWKFGRIASNPSLDNPNRHTHKVKYGGGRAHLKNAIFQAIINGYIPKAQAKQKIASNPSLYHPHKHKVKYGGGRAHLKKYIEQRIVIIDVVE